MEVPLQWLLSITNNIGIIGIVTAINILYWIIKAEINFQTSLDFKVSPFKQMESSSLSISSQKWDQKIILVYETRDFKLTIQGTKKCQLDAR